MRVPHSGSALEATVSRGWIPLVAFLAHVEPHAHIVDCHGAAQHRGSFNIHEPWWNLNALSRKVFVLQPVTDRYAAVRINQRPQAPRHLAFATF